MNMSTDEVAARLNVPEGTLRWWRHKGVGPPSFRLGGRVFYRSDDVESWEQTEYDSSVCGDYGSAAGAR